METNFFYIIKWKKLLYIAFLLFLFKYFFLYGFGFKTILSFLDLAILSLAIVLIIASAYLTSYYFRKQNKHVKFTLKKAKYYAIILAILGFGFGVFVSLKIEKKLYILIFVFSIITITVYAIKNKKKTFINNLAKSFLKAFIILLVFWFDAPKELNNSQWELLFNLQSTIIIYAILSFLTNIIREIIKDIININNDNFNNQETLPILLGRKRARNIALVISIFVSSVVFSLILFFIENTYISVTIFILGTAPQLVFIHYLTNANTPKQYQFLSKISDIALLLGILSIPVLSYYFKYVI